MNEEWEINGAMVQIPIGGLHVAPLEKYSAYEVSANDNIVPPEPIIKIGESIVATAGNVITLSGDSKSGKSSLTNVIIAGSIVSGGYDGFPGLDVKVNKDKQAVIHFDTEQSTYKQYETLTYGIMKRTGFEFQPSHLRSYNLRSLGIEEYQSVVTGICQEASELYGGIHSIYIDGFADFINSVNDDKESNAIVDYFTKLAIEFDTILVGIVHVNPGGKKQRGHLGSQLQRKSESVINVIKEDGYSYIHPDFMRNSDVSEFSFIKFKYSKEAGYHQYAGIKEYEEKTTTELDRRDLALKIFSEVPKRYKDAYVEIMNQQDVSERTAKSRISEMVNFNIVTKLEDKTYVLKLEDDLDE